MNEHVTADCGVLVPASRSEPRHLGRNFFVDPSALETTVARLVTASPDAAKSLGVKARQRFEELNRGFVTRLRAVFDAETCANPYTRSADGDGIVCQ